MKRLIGVRTGSHILCNSIMYKSLQQKEKAALSHCKQGDVLDGKRILQWTWDPVLRVWMGDAILNPKTGCSFRHCSSVGFVLTQSWYGYGHLRTVTPGLKLRFLTSTKTARVGLVFLFHWGRRKSPWFSNAPPTGQMLEIIVGKK